MVNQMSNMNCPLCNEGSLTAVTRVKVFARPHGEVNVDLLFSHCDRCGSDLVTEEQSRENKKRLRAREKQYDGYLTGQQILGLRRRYNLTQKDAGKLFGGGPVAFSKYESEDIVPTDSMNKLLKVAIEFPDMVDFLAQSAGVALKGIASRRHESPDLFRDSSAFSLSPQNTPTLGKNMLGTLHPEYAKISGRFTDTTTQFGECAANDGNHQSQELEAA